MLGVYVRTTHYPSSYYGQGLYTEVMDNLNQSSLNDLLSNPVNLIPESLITTITIGFVALNVLGLAFVVLYIINLVRKWKVESAVFHMQKDLAEIKQSLQAAQPAKPVQNEAPVLTDEPTEQ